MTKPENNPYVLLENEGIAKKMLSPKAIKVLELYDRAAGIAAKQPKSVELKAQTENAGKLAQGIIVQEIDRIKQASKNDIEEQHKKTVQKAQSKRIIEKSDQVLDDLALCRKKLKEDHQKKLASGEIAPPKKKTLTTKLRSDLGKLVGRIPEKLKTDPKIIERTEKAILKFLNELKDIWGMNKIKPIEDDINEKFNKLREQAA